MALVEYYRGSQAIQTQNCLEEANCGLKKA